MASLIHVWTQAVILLCLLAMIIIFISLIYKFRERNSTSGPKRTQIVSHTSQSSISTTKFNSQSSNRSVSNPTRKKPILKFYQVTTITSILSFIIAVAIDFGDGVYYFDTGIDVFHTDEYWLILLTNICFVISSVSLYIFMFGRLYIVFNKSGVGGKYKMSRITVFSVCFLMVLQAFSLLFYTTTIGMIHDFITIGDFYEYLNASFIIILVNDFFLNTVLLSLFVYKLQQTILDCSVDYYSVKYYEEDMNQNTSDVNLNKQQTKMITVITRHTILSAIALMFDVIFYISIIYGSNIEVYSEADLFFLSYSNMIKAIYGFVVAFTLYLNFSFSLDLYHVCCNQCHLCCYKCFVVITKKKIVKKQKEIENSQKQILETVQLSTET